MKKRQLELFQSRAPRQFGGRLLTGNAKRARPLSSKHPIHLVVKSQIALGRRSLLSPRNADVIDRLVRRHASLNGIRIYHFVNVGNHLHLVIRLGSSSRLGARRAFQRFIRAVTGLIARHVLEAERASGKGVKFWQARPFTRLANWGRDFQRLAHYMQRNRQQARWVPWGFSILDPLKIELLQTG